MRQLLLATLLAFAATLAHAGSAAAGKRERWVERNGTLQCLAPSGKILRSFERGVPTYHSPLPEIPPDYKSASFVVSRDSTSAVVFDLHHHGTSVTFYADGCEPSRTTRHEGLEATQLLHYTSNQGIFAALTPPNVDRDEEFKRLGYFIQWTGKGDELLRAGPYDVDEALSKGCQFYHAERFCYFQLHGAHFVFFDLVNHKHHEYRDWSGTRYGRMSFNVSEDGKITIAGLLHWITPQRKAVTPKELRAMPTPKRLQILPESKEVWEVVHEHQF